MPRTAKPKVNETIEQTEVKDTFVKPTPEPKKVVEKTKRELQPTTMVRCVNNTLGGLTYRSQYGGKGLRVQGYGKQVRIQLQDLETLYNEQPTIITEGWLYILDEDVIEYMYLTDLYGSLISPKDMDKFIKLPENAIKEKLVNSPLSMKTTITRVIQNKINNGDLTDVARIHFFENVLGKKLDV